MAWDQIKTLDQIESERSDRWWQSDFSWGGRGLQESWPGHRRNRSGKIERKPSTANNRATLQDYWRRGPGSGREASDASDSAIDAAMRASGELIELPDGSTWHICHMPLALQSGEKTEKSTWRDTDWNFVENILIARIRAGRATETDSQGEATKIEKRACLKGIVVDKIPIVDCEYHVMLTLSYVSKHADFSGINFGSAAAFSSCTFLAGASFRNAIFKRRAWFDTALFRLSATFNEAVFEENAYFGSSIFSDYARFDSTDFKNAAIFESCNFYGYARFEGASFKQLAYFVRCTFAVTADFNKTTFREKCDFLGANFESQAWFQTAIAGSFSFRNAHFAQTATFNLDVADPERLSFQSFYGATFAGIADFTGSGTRLICAFDNCLFEKALIFDYEASPNRVEFHRTLLPGTLRAALAVHQLLIEESPLEKRELKQNLEKITNQRLSALEGGYRSLAAVMGRTQNERLEQRFHRFQLLARRRRTDVGRAERLFSYLYDTFSSYGADALRPLIWLLGSGTICLIMYAVLLSASWPPSWQFADQADALKILVRAARISISHTFPFGSSSGAPDMRTTPLAVSVLAILQANFSAVLLFLFGLSLRQFFRIR